jgi:hypothetical protein
MLTCHCQDWLDYWPKLESQMLFCQLSSAAPKYTGAMFVYCPYCSEKLVSVEYDHLPYASIDDSRQTRD